MDSFDIEIIEGINTGKINDLNSFMVELGGIQQCEDLNMSYIIPDPNNANKTYTIEKAGIAYVPVSEDTTSIKLAQFQALVEGLRKGGYITLTTKPGDDLNRSRTIRLCRDGHPREINSTFYQDNWNLLFKKIVPLPTLATLLERPIRREIGFKFKS